MARSALDSEPSIALLSFSSAVQFLYIGDDRDAAGLVLTGF